jgi:hypothetical protein
MQAPRAALAAALLLPLLAGCLSGGPEPSPPPCAVEPCPAPAPFDAALAGCREATFTIDAPQSPYALPAGFQAIASPSGGQLVAVELGVCETLSAAGSNETAVSYGTVAVLVEPPGRGEREGSDLFAVEVLTDSAALAGRLAAAGFPVRDATLSIAEDGNLRTVTAAGEVSYQAHVAHPPTPGPRLVYKDNLHSESGWYALDRDCIINQGTGAATVLAADGALADAGPGGASAGRGTQPVGCSLHLILA